MREQLANQDLQRARDAAAVQAEEDLAEYELEMEARELAKELGLQHAEEDLEALKEKLRAERDAKLEARGQEVADRLDAHRKEQADEKRHGKVMAKIMKFGRSKELGIGRSFLDTMLKLSTGGSKKMQKIQEAAERARLLLQMATKPIEAYAETSASFPWPVGPVLGVLHAAAVAASIGGALRAVGGGGGGGNMPRSVTGGDTSAAVLDTVAKTDSVRSPAAPDVAGETDADPQEPTVLPPIHITVNLEADGLSLAQIVARHTVQAEDV